PLASASALVLAMFSAVGLAMVENPSETRGRSHYGQTGWRISDDPTSKGSNGIDRPAGERAGATLGIGRWHVCEELKKTSRRLEQTRGFRRDGGRRANILASRLGRPQTA